MTITKNTSKLAMAEKTAESVDQADASEGAPSTVELGISNPVNALQRFCNRLDAVCGVEARGIERIPEALRERNLTYRDYLHMFTM
jgi:hypothetical protein